MFQALISGGSKSSTTCSFRAENNEHPGFYQPVLFCEYLHLLFVKVIFFWHHYTSFITSGTKINTHSITLFLLLLILCQ